MASTWIFSGPSGIGKKMTALGLAQALVCEKSDVGCGECPSCIRIEKGQSENLLVITPSGTQIKIDQARSVLDFLSLQGQGPSRIVIIDDCDKLNPTAANSLLKTLEEPPAGSYFFLICENLASILPTIRSRSQIMKFSPLSSEDLKRVVSAPDWILSSARGSVGQAKVLGEDDAWSSLRQSTFQFLSKLGGNGASPIGDVKDLIKDKESAFFVAKILQTWVRDLLALSVSGGGAVDLVHQDQAEFMQSYLERISAKGNLAEQLDELWKRAFRLERDIRGNVDRQLCFEGFFLQMV